MDISPDFIHLFFRQLWRILKIDYPTQKPDNLVKTANVLPCNTSYLSGWGDDVWLVPRFLGSLSYPADDLNFNNSGRPNLQISTCGLSLLTVFNDRKFVETMQESFSCKQVNNGSKIGRE